MAEMESRGVAILDSGICGDASRAVERSDLSGVADLIAYRSQTHGNFKRTAEVAQKIKAVLRNSPNWDRLSPIQQEALEHMYSKVARILCGNPRCVDHYKDIAGYAMLAVEELERDSRSG